MTHLSVVRPGWPEPPKVRLQRDMGQPWTPCPQDTPCGQCRHEMRAHWQRNPACSLCGCDWWRRPGGTAHR